MFLNDKFKNQKISKLRQFVNKAPSNAVNMGLGEIRFDLHPKVKSILNDIIETESFFYTSNSGLARLKELILQKYQAQASVCVTCGAEEAIFATLFAVLKKGDEVLLPNPTYPAYESIIKMLGAKPVFFNLDKDKNFALDRNSFTYAISNRTKAIIFPNPSNPLGTAFPHADIEFIKNASQKHDFLIIADEIYAELYLDKPLKTFFSSSDNVVVISGISKAFAMAGWRLGWVVSKNHNLIKGITVAHQYIATCAPVISQKVAIKLLEQEEFFLVYYRKRLKELFNYSYNFFKNEMVGVKLLNYQAAPYLFVSFETDDFFIAEKLLKNGVLVIPGSIFGSNGKYWIRLNYALKKEILAKGLDIIHNTIKKYLQ